MGLNIFGSSKGDSSTTNDYRQDNSVSIQEGDLSGGSIRAGGSVTVTDQGAIDRAFDGIEGATRGAFQFGDSMADRSFDGINKANDRAFAFGDSALDLAGGSLVESYKFGGQALDTMADNAAETYNAISENNRRSYDVIERATNPGGAAAADNSKLTLASIAGLVILSAWSLTR